MDLETLKSRIGALPRVPLAHLPTPLEELPRLTAALGGPRLLVKRDDCTGLALGGNKARQFEFAFGDARSQGADAIVTGAASQSNHCRQAAAASARLGLPCFLALRKDARRDPVQGNLLLMRLLGADVRFVDAQMGPEMAARLQELASELRAQGRTPYVIASDRGNAACAAAYVAMVAELEEQLAARGVRPTHVYVCSAGPTGAGMALGAKLLGVAWKLVCVAPIRWPFPAETKMAKIASNAAEYLGVDARLEPGEIDVRSDYIGPEYGAFTPEAREAMDLAARTEGIVLDPVYTAKCLAGLIDHVKAGTLTARDTIIFVHTGGAPALFAYAPELAGPPGR